jgi:hypothetical protein
MMDAQPRELHLAFLGLPPWLQYVTILFIYQVHPSSFLPCLLCILITLFNAREYIADFLDELVARISLANRLN